MKVSGLLNRFNQDLEDKKRSLQRKDAGEAYKKHAQYATAGKKSLVQALENLLSGKTEKELHEVDAATRKDSDYSSVEPKEKFLEQTEVNKEMERLKQTEKEVNIQEDSHKDIAQIQQVRAEQNGSNFVEDEVALFLKEDFAFNIPERFQSDFTRDPQKQTVFGKDLENVLFQRTYNKAVEKYSAHMTMVKMGYNPLIEPTFSQSA